MKNTIIAFLSIFFVLAIITDASAQNRKEMMHKFQKMQEQLNLTDQQKTKIEDLRLKHQEQMIDMRAELNKARLENHKLRKSEKLNRSDLLNQTKKMNAIKNKIAEARANHKMDVYELLTADQRKTWNEMKFNRPRFKESRKKSNCCKGFRENGDRF